MCDDQILQDMDKLAKSGDVSRRAFGALSIGAGFVAALPRAANALAVKGTDVVIKTPDGEAEAYFVAPTSGKHPAVLVWTDIFGLRPAFRQMADRLAESGYAVLTPNPYYRAHKLAQVPQNLDFSKPDERAQLVKLMSALTPTTQVTDATAFIAWLDAHASVDTGKKVGTTGYCMGGAITVRTAAALPNRVGAAGSFHGGSLVTKDESSPHLLIPKIKAAYLFAIAENDDKTQPEAKDVLRAECAKNNVKAEIEVYPAQHGWCPPDAAVYNKEQAEKAWSRLLATLKAGGVA